jgi:CRP-like cAMP-binding protein
MSTNLKKFIRRFVTLSDAELEEITNQFKSKLIKKNDHVLREGDTCKDFVFVQKGCLRLYYVKDDIEVSVWFAFQESSAIEIYSFISESLYSPRNRRH